jgi:hypothetical protein
MTIDADAVSRTRPYEPPKARPNGPGDAAEDIALLPVVAASSLAGRPAPPRPWHVPDMIPGR